MSIIHILAGAGSGFMVGGPIGAVVGAVAGGVMAPSAPSVVTEVGPANAAPSAAASADLVNAIVVDHAPPAYTMDMPVPATSRSIPAGTVALPPFTPAPINTAPSAGAQADLVNTMIATGAGIPALPPVLPLEAPRRMLPPSKLCVQRRLGVQYKSGTVFCAGAPRVGPGGPAPAVNYSDYGDIGGFPLWLVVTGLGTLAYAVWRR